MADYNLVVIVGRLSRDPELKYTPKGSAVARIGMAINRTWKSETGEQREEVTFVDVEAWGRQAETASQYLTRGRPVYIEGRLRVEEWTDRDGKPRHTLEVHATDMQFIGGGAGARDEGGTPPAKAAAAAGREPAPEATDLNDDDIPF